MAEWPLIGRAEKLRTLRGLLLGRDARGVVLAGPSGVGKTRLGSECLRLAEDAGFATARATATRASSQLPFGALALLVEPVRRGPGAVDDRADLVRRSARALVERAGDRRLVLFVDDAHLLDDASATLVHQIAASGSATVLATVSASAPDPIVALWKDGLVERVEVGGLSEEAMGELLVAVLEGPVDPAVVAQLAERSRGNILFLRELVEGALQDGTLHDEGGIWHLRRPLSPSTRLVDIVESRLGRLDEDERNLLELVAFGAPLGQGELSLLADRELAEALERRDLLASSMEGRRLVVRLAHPLYGDVLRERMPALRQRGLARSLADAVEAAGARRVDDALRVATWRLVGGGGQPDLMLEGATIARWRYDFPLAERLARAAVDVGAGFEAEFLLAGLAALQGRQDEAERVLAALAATAVDDAERGRVAVARYDNAWLGVDLLQVLDTADDTITDAYWHDQIASRRLSMLINAHGPRAAVEAAMPLLDRVRDEGLVFACMMGAYGLARLGRLDDALDVVARGAAAQQELSTPIPWYPWWHDVERCLVLHYAGRFEEADRIALAGHRQALADGSAEAQAFFALCLANPVADRGHLETAALSAREALALDQQLGRPMILRLDYIYLALALALGGHAREAAGALAAFDALGLPPVLLDELDLVQARAWTAAAEGDLPRARHHLERGADRGEEIGDLVGEAAALHALARLGRAREVRGRLAAVAVRVEGDLAPARSAHADALAHADAVGLEKVSYDFEAMGADLLAAEAAADAAVARRRAGERREAAAAERRSGLLAQRAGDPVTPALQAIEVRVQLTPAERETALLAAAGQTNKEIARQLYLSSRTVENRLYRVYEKLGISSRAELARALGSDTGPPL